jgi:hypothetical protein
MSLIKSSPMFDSIEVVRETSLFESRLDRPVSYPLDMRPGARFDVIAVMPEGRVMIITGERDRKCVEESLPRFIGQYTDYTVRVTLAGYYRWNETYKGERPLI